MTELRPAVQLVLAFVALQTVAPTTQVSADLRAIEDLTATRIAETGGLGAAFTLIEGNRIVASEAIGDADTEGTPLGADMVFAAASMTKPVVAVAVLQLEDRGLIDLDAPVSRYLPWFTTRDTEQTAAIRVRDLLNHTSGFPRAAGVRNGMLAADLPTDNPERFRRIVTGSRLSHEPGEVYEYSNVNYHLLGQIIEAVSGTFYSDYVAVNVFEPIGMTSTRMNEPKPGVPYAPQHRMIFGQAVPLNENRAIAGSAGGLFTTTADYARFLIAVATEDTRLVPPGTLDRILNEPNERYRLGWQITEADDHGVILFHNGWAIGGSSTAAISPRTGRGFVSMTNAAEGYAGNDTPAITDHPRALAFGIEPGEPRSFLLQKAILGTVVLLFAVNVFWAVRLAREPMAGSRIWLVGASVVQAAIGLAIPFGLPRVFAADLGSAVDLYPGAAVLLILAGASTVGVALFRLRGLSANMKATDPQVD